MQTHNVRVTCDVKINYTGDLVPSYRLYVGEEMFVERRYLYDCSHLEEIIPISAPAGRYQINVLLLPHPNATIKVKNLQVTDGPGQLHKNTLEINNADS